MRGNRGIESYLSIPIVDPAGLNASPKGATMKISMHNWMRAESLEVTLARLERYGYDGLEISGEPSRFEPREVRRLLERHRLVCWGAVTLMTDGRDLIHPDRYVRVGTLAYLKDCVTLVRDLGGTMLCVVPSTVGKTTPLASPEEEWSWAVEGLKQVADWAGQAGLKVGIEPINRFETYFINRGDQALRLAQEVGGDHVGVVLDAFHIQIEEADPLGAIRAVGSKLIDFHVADNNRRPPGEGRIDWRGIVRTLREIGYQGHLTSEFVLPMDRTPLADPEQAGQIEVSDDKFLRDHATGAVSESYYDRCVERTGQFLRGLISD
jgi:sugar phosphate isomerase/epimerase